MKEMYRNRPGILPQVNLDKLILLIFVSLSVKYEYELKYGCSEDEKNSVCTCQFSVYVFLQISTVKVFFKLYT